MRIKRLPHYTTYCCRGSNRLRLYPETEILAKRPICLAKRPICSAKRPICSAKRPICSAKRPICLGLRSYDLMGMPHPWITMECSQPVAWTTNRSLLVASRGRPFQEDRPIPARPYPELRTWMVVRSGVISVFPTLWKCSGISRHTTNHLALSRMHTKHQLHPCSHPTHHSHDYHTHTPTVTNPTAFHAQL